MNFILIVLDGVRYDAFHSTHAPALRVFGRRKMSFTNTISASNWTLPAVASIITGMYPHMHGAVKTADKSRGSIPVPIHPDSFTIQVGLKAKNYKTAGFVGGCYVSKLANFHLFFDEYDEAVSGIKIPRNDLSNTLQKARSFIESVGKDPYFLFIHTLENHAPFAPPQEYLKKYGVSNLGLRGSFSPDCMDGDDIIPEKVAQVFNCYLAGINYTDDLLLDFFAFLASYNVFDDTMVIITSDHGTAFYEHSLVGHGGDNMYEEVIKVPLVVSIPGGKFSQKLSMRLAQHTDILPTIFKFADLPYGDYPGIPLDEYLGLVEGFCGNVYRPHGPRVFAYKLGMMKAIKLRTQKDWLVFNLQNDPLELNPYVAESPTGRAKQLLQTISKEYGLYAPFFADSDSHTPTTIINKMKEYSVT